ncbi:MAG: sodium:proton antiporter [Bacteroidales bacterium]|nr:sodium:proton antiporter [Bacteroidales bacterium]
MEHAVDLPLWSLVPFVVMLMMVAVAPLMMEKTWEKNSTKLIVSLVLGVPVAVFLINQDMSEALEHQLLYDYVPFIVLLASLFVVTGGIHLSGDLLAKPLTNTVFLATGYVFASLMGTTGAAMLLIRPLLETNSQRKYNTHTVLFFIAMVANCGGLLTPLGDPPLFLLYLRGASFTWLLHMFPAWLLVGAILLTIYYFLDSYWYKKESEHRLFADEEERRPLKIYGHINIVYLLLIVAAVAFINVGFIPAMGDPESPVWVRFLREIVLLSIIGLSLYSTKPEVRSSNRFSWNPILEVAAVFLGIFTTMIPAMLFLKSHAASFGLSQPWQFFYSTGMLSSFLDNAPTALAFHGVATGLVDSGAALAEVAGVPEVLLEAISMGAVFFGAMTYIGNGPNFMVKAISEEYGYKMPSFFGYMYKFSLCVLLPVYIIVQLVFFFFF